MTPSGIVASVVRLKNMVPLARLSDPRPSRLAASQVAEFSDNQATAVLACLVMREPHGMTADELEDLLKMRGAHQRLSDLKGHGLAYGTGRTKPTRWNATAEVYRAHASVVRQVTGETQGRLL